MTDAMRANDNADFPYAWQGHIDYESAEHASLVQQALAVDPELRPKEVERTLSTEGPVLVMHFRAKQLRMLRAAVGTFLDLVALATRTLDAFKSTIKPA